MKRKVERAKRKMRILRYLTVFMIINLGIIGHLRSGEAVIPDRIEVQESNFRGLSKSEAEEVMKIWRVIEDQEIVECDGKEWLSKTDVEKREVIKKACEAWRKAGYQKVKSIEYFIEDIEKYYNRVNEKGLKKRLEAKTGLVISLSTFFAGMEKNQKDR